MSKRMIIACTIAGLALSPAFAQHPTTPAQADVAKQSYQPFEWLIGDWDSPGGANETIHQRLRFGPDRAYITNSTYIGRVGGAEQLHFEGIMVWNGRTEMLDYVFAVAPGSGIQEKGTIRVEVDGLVVREVELTDAKGAVTNFRQTFRSTGKDSAVTSLMRQGANGWQPNFPGSDRIEMRRRAASSGEHG